MGQRLASLVNCRESSGASVASTIIIDPSGGSRFVCCQFEKVASSLLPKFVNTRQPTVYVSLANETIREAVPMPPLYPKQTIPLPAPDRKSTRLNSSHVAI